MFLRLANSQEENSKVAAEPAVFGLTPPLAPRAAQERATRANAGSRARSAVLP